jgi:zinc protease
LGEVQIKLERMLSVKLGILAIALCSVAAGAHQSGPAEVFPFPVHEKTLDNGLRIVAIPYDSPGLVSFYLIVRTGSRDEVEAGHSGFAHFFEHMMFRGTERYSPEAYNDVLKRMGADANASTYDDRTVYYMTGPASGFETMVDIEADRFKNLKYTEDAFRTEALAVLGEYNKSASSPFLPLIEKLRDLAYMRHTYKHTTLGFLADIKAMPGYYKYSLDFFRRFYRPDNVIALVVGDVAPDRANAVIAKHFSDWKRGYEPPKIEAEPPQKERRTAHIEWPNPTRPYLMIGYHTPAFTTATVDFPALDIISELLFSEAAPLYQELVVKQQIADFISGGAEDHRDPYLFIVTARVKSEDASAKVLAAVKEHFEKVKNEPVDEARLRRVTSHLRNRFTQSLDTPDAVADRVSHYLSLTGSVGTINDLFRRYQEVTPADIQRAAGRTFRPENETVVTLAQRGKAPEVK